jgi:hypothetical protein
MYIGMYVAPAGGLCGLHARVRTVGPGDIASEHRAERVPA